MKAREMNWDLTFLSTFDSKYLGTGLQSTQAPPDPLLIFKNKKMMRNKDKSQGEEGSVHSNASRYDLSTYFFFFLVKPVNTLFTLTALGYCRCLIQNILLILLPF